MRIPRLSDLEDGALFREYLPKRAMRRDYREYVLDGNSVHVAGKPDMRIRVGQRSSSFQWEMKVEMRSKT